MISAPFRIKVIIIIRSRSSAKAPQLIPTNLTVVIIVVIVYPDSAFQRL